MVACAVNRQAVRAEQAVRTLQLGPLIVCECQQEQPVIICQIKNAGTDHEDVPGMGSGLYLGGKNCRQRIGSRGGHDDSVSHVIRPIPADRK